MHNVLRNKRNIAFKYTIIHLQKRLFEKFHNLLNASWKIYPQVHLATVLRSNPGI